MKNHLVMAGTIVAALAIPLAANAQIEPPFISVAAAAEEADIFSVTIRWASA